MQNATQTQPSRAAKATRVVKTPQSILAAITAADQQPAVSHVAPVKDAELEMRQAVDGLLMLLLSEAEDEEIVSGLMIFLHQIAEQHPVAMQDCLQWAVTRCYQWTMNCNQAQKAYAASILQERAEWKAQWKAAQATDIAPGNEMEG